MSRSALVTVKWLADKLTNPGKYFRLLDASLHLPSSGRDAKEEYQSNHISSALFFDINVCVDSTSEYPYMLPRPQQFEDYVGSLGITNKTHVVLYDNNDKFGVFSAPRLWWMFRTFGHHDVSILEGGLPSWIQKGQTVSTAATPPVENETFKSTFNLNLVKNIDQIEDNINNPSFQLVDARPNITSGHIVKAYNIPFTKIVDHETREVRKVPELQKLFTDAGVDLQKPIVTNCGSGISACSIALAAYLCGKDDVAVYDGSWAEFRQKGKSTSKANVPD